MSAWTGKPCARCGKAKGPKFLDRKFCFRCSQAEKKDARTRAHRAHVAKTYGLLPGDYDALYLAQDGLCYICRRATGKTRRLPVDHNHKLTGRAAVRGLLCGPCNDMLGHARDDPAFFLRAAQYLQHPPAHEILSREP